MECGTKGIERCRLNWPLDTRSHENKSPGWNGGCGDAFSEDYKVEMDEYHSARR